MVKAAIISIGDELLIGQTINTNASWLGKTLAQVGIKSDLVITIGDEENKIKKAVSEGLQSADIVLITGGLGPTKDDITKKTLADFFETDLVPNDTLMAMIEAYYKKRNRPIIESNRMLAYMPANCEVIINNRGTAAGMWWNKNGKVVISMPGVPYEMKGMISENIIPKLKSTFNLPKIIHKTIMTAGQGESILATKIEDIEDNLPAHIKLAYLPNSGIVKIRLSGYSSEIEKLQSEIDELATQIIDRLKKYHYGFDDQPIAEAVQNLFIKNNWKLALAESCTGGKISSLLVNVAGSSKYYKGSIVAYDYDIKSKILNVDAAVIEEKGAVSAAVVEAMAVNARTVLNADYSIAVSGIAGPGGGLPDKPVGTVWFGLASKEKVVSKKVNFPLDREKNIALTANFALHYLLQFVQEMKSKCRKISYLCVPKCKFYGRS